MDGWTTATLTTPKSPRSSADGHATVGRHRSDEARRIRLPLEPYRIAELDVRVKRGREERRVLDNHDCARSSPASKREIVYVPTRCAK